MKLNIRKAEKPFIWFALGLAVLCAASFVVFSYPVWKTLLVNPIETSERKASSAKLITAPVSYKAAEDFKASNVELPQHNFGSLQVNKSKINKGIQLFAKQGHVQGQYAAPDGIRMDYLVQRQQLEGSNAWVQVDLVSADPQTQQMLVEPIGFTYSNGEQLEAGLQSSGLSGYLSGDEFLYTTVKNEHDEWVYLVNKFNFTHKTITPVMELFRYSYKAVNGGKPPIIYSSQLAPDKSHLLVRDSRNGISSYDLSTGEIRQAIEGSNEVKAGEYFELLVNSGIALYSTSRYQNDVSWIDLSTGMVRQPLLSEQGFVEVGMDVQGKIMYYNFTYDRLPENVMMGDKQSLLLPNGVQMIDKQGNPTKRFSLSKDAKERLEFGGYSESKKTVLLHKFIVAMNGNGQPYKKTLGWLLGDMSTGSMTMLSKTDVPDNWDKKDILFGKVTLSALVPSNQEQVFVNLLENNYYMTRWKTSYQVQLLEDEDIVIYEDEGMKRMFVSSLTRPDLVVAALNYKKYNWDNNKFSLLSGHWLARYQKQPEGDKMYFFQWN
ncbi:hypothetical protein [Paenibacillus radicis (ex Xue et al. 2023)]|uniref:Regulatory protein YycH domain-containing protein n=1 Tax=Paenibacillus radicis (ex Xue et al. 2023) TaxID=2972489 RepID=A0ABT1YEE4_9BACL|nr:hypothetical protein [Paenibacillus radicis (ex Xue et al. 2023)]MCR8631130.1 hypothetical protein [Paenibacillus radicis (ex Xue et al. 2023)]